MSSSTSNSKRVVALVLVFLLAGGAAMFRVHMVLLDRRTPRALRLLLLGDSRVKLDLPALAAQIERPKTDFFNGAVGGFALEYSRVRISQFPGAADACLAIGISPAQFSSDFATISGRFSREHSRRTPILANRSEWSQWTRDVDRQIKSWFWIPTSSPFSFNPQDAARLLVFGDKSLRGPPERLRRYVLRQYLGEEGKPGVLASVQEERLRKFEAILEAWKLAGRRVFLFRMPVGETVRAAEENTIAPAWFHQWSEPPLSLPYQDFSATPYQMADDAHIQEEESGRFSRELGAWLLQQGVQECWDPLPQGNP